MWTGQGTQGGNQERCACCFEADVTQETQLLNLGLGGLG